MLTVRRGSERGHFDHGWLDTFHTFSFGRYFDPDHMGFRALRVINEDRVAPGSGFGMHGHADMEILTYVISGRLAHRDSLGNTSIIHAGEYQRMTAGTGIRHGEFNPSAEEPVHLHQIWIEPDRLGHEPEYEQKRFDDGRLLGKLGLIASPDGREGSLTIHQAALIFRAALEAGESTGYRLAPGRHAWLQVISGALRVERESLEAGDGLAISEISGIEFTAITAAEFLLFDLS